MGKNLHVTANASGAVEGAKRGDVVVIVDVIDMSTTAEALLEQEPLGLFGASPTQTKAPVFVNPENIGYMAGKMAVKGNTQVLIISEPRWGEGSQRRDFARKAIEGIEKAGGVICGIYPNLGAETAKMVDACGKVVLLVTDTGGVAYDAAYHAGGGAVITGTIARTLKKKGTEPAYAAARRAIQLAEQRESGITIVAASGNSWEDVLAAQYLSQVIIQEGFLRLR